MSINEKESLQQQWSSDATMKQIREEQKRDKPQIEDVISNFLSGDALKNASDFIAFLRINKLNPRWSATCNWTVKYKGKNLLILRLHGSAWQYDLEVGSWHIDYKGFGFLDRFTSCNITKDFLYSNIRYCINCCACSPGRNITVLGKQFNNVCRLVIKNPDAEALECVKKLIEANKHEYT